MSHAASGPKKTTAQDAGLVWANAQLAAHGKTTKLMSYKDQFLRDSRCLLELVSCLNPKAVNPAMIATGDKGIIIILYSLY